MPNLPSSLSPKTIQVDEADKQHASCHDLLADGPLPSCDTPENARITRGGATHTLCSDSSVPLSNSSNSVSMSELRNVEHGFFANDSVQATQVPSPPVLRAAAPTLQEKIQSFWVTNKGLALVMIAKFFGALMNATIRLMETDGNDGKGYHPLQILFARMGITAVCSSYYMWYKETEHFPLGMKEVRSLLVARGFMGFFAIFGMYYSLLYLPLGEATVLTFLSPSLACWACSYFIDEPFTRMEQIAAYISLLGVFLIARPFSFFASVPQVISPTGRDVATTPSLDSNETMNHLPANHNTVTPAQRTGAVAIALLGVIGGAGAFTTIRWIGKRAHPLISVNYFAVCCTLFSMFAMITVPGVEFLLPRHFMDWCYLIFLGVCGFIMQFLLAAGLQYEKSSRATNMVYTQMIFALAFDKLIWDTTPGLLSITGSSLILGSAVYVAMNKEETEKNGSGRGGDEERVLIDGWEEEEEEEIGLRPL